MCFDRDNKSEHFEHLSSLQERKMMLTGCMTFAQGDPAAKVQSQPVSEITTLEVTSSEMAAAGPGHGWPPGAAWTEFSYSRRSRAAGERL